MIERVATHETAVDDTAADVGKLVLRRFTEQARDEAFSSHASPHHQELRTRGRLGLVLRGRGDVRARSIAWRSERP